MIRVYHTRVGFKKKNLPGDYSVHLECENHCYKRIFVVVRASRVKLSVSLVKIVVSIREVCAFPVNIITEVILSRNGFALDFLLGVYSCTWSVQRTKIEQTPWRVSVISQEFLCPFSFCYRKWADLRRICRKFTIINYDMGNMEAVG